MRVSVDANIFISSFYFKSTVTDEVLTLISKCFVMNLSDIVIEEILKFTIFKSKKKSDQEIRELYDFIFDHAFELYEYKNQTDHTKIQIRDKSDYKVLISAMEARCDIFVTGDKDFLEVKYDDIQIMTPRQFVDAFQDYL